MTADNAFSFPADAGSIAADPSKDTSVEVAPTAGKEAPTSTEEDATVSSGHTTAASDTTVSADAAVSESAGVGEKKKEYFIKKANPLLLQARKEYIQKYVSRTQEKLDNRPDLTYWKRAITSSIMVDTKFELDTARRDVDECLYYCPSCLMERWEGGMFCWNENCKESPIYWKLPGTRGKPLTPRKPKPTVTSQVAMAAGGTQEVTRTVSNKKWSVNLIDNVASVNGNNENYLSYHKNDDNPSAARPGKDAHEYNYYYEHPTPKIPRLNPVVTDDLLHKPFSQILDGHQLTEDGDKKLEATPSAVTELNLSNTHGHNFYDNDETNKLCHNKSIFMDDTDVDGENY